MTNTIQFTRDLRNDIVIATPHWKLETEADVIAWYAHYVDYMKQFGGRKVDIILVLDHFEVKASIGSVFGKYRALIHQNYTRHSFRVHSSKTVRLFVNTSGARYNVETQEADTVEDAVQGILAMRKQAQERL